MQEDSKSVLNKYYTKRLESKYWLKSILFYKILALIATTIGVFSSLIFQILLRCPRSANKKVAYKENRTLNLEKILKFCKSAQLYQVAIVFTACKLLINVALVYMPLFINESAIEESSTIASIPLMAYLSSLVTSMAVEYVKPCINSGKVSLINVTIKKKKYSANYT